MYLAILNVSCFCLLAPILTLTLTFLYIYRYLVGILLKFQLKDKFIGFLEGTDCVWAVESEPSLSVINVLALLERDSKPHDIDLLTGFRNFVKNRLLIERFEKLSHLRNKRYGYFFWERCDGLDIEDHVKWLEEDHSRCNGTCDSVSEDCMKRTLSKVCNKPLPRGHKMSWEILVGRNCSMMSSTCLQKIEEGRVFNEDGTSGKQIRIPVLFRVHHSLGDGMALLGLLLETVADLQGVKVDVCDTRIRDPEIAKKQGADPDTKDVADFTPRWNTSISEISPYRQNLLGASMPFTSLVGLESLGKTLQYYFFAKLKVLKYACTVAGIRGIFLDKWKKMKELMERYVNERLREMTKIATILIVSPSCLIHQALRSMDNNALHGPKLTGEKIISYWMERDLKDPRELDLLAKIKNIKDFTSTRFGDVILAALSSSIHKYFLKIGEFAPKTLSAVILSRMTAPKQHLTLENNFTVGLLPLCISAINNEPSKRSEDKIEILERLYDVAKSSEKLRKNPDYQINFWVMKWLSAVLPEALLRPVLESHSTLVFSNLPGPSYVRILDHNLRNVAFWVPHRGSTGIGCALLTYAGNVHLSLIADRAVINNEKLFEAILNETVQEIESMYESVRFSRFSKQLHSVISAPMKNSIGELNMQ